MSNLLKPSGVHEKSNKNEGGFDPSLQFFPLFQRRYLERESHTGEVESNAVSKGVTGRSAPVGRLDQRPSSIKRKQKGNQIFYA